LLDEAGFFEWAALYVARWGGGHGRRLFVLTVLLGAAVSALFANDGAALILTPIVIAMLRALGFKDKATLAFVMAAGFIADTASLPLVVSNLVNIVSADFFKIGFGDYAAVMVPVDLVSIAATLGALLIFFRRDIPRNYDVAALRAPGAAIRDTTTFRAGWIVLALLLAGFFLLEPLGVPVSAVAVAGAILLLVTAGRGHVIQTGKVLRGAPWQVVIFSLGMYLVVYGLRNAGLTDHLAALLDRPAQGGVWGAALGTGVIAAVLSSMMNNMPTVLLGALDRRDPRDGRDQGSNDLRQRDRLRSRPQADADRLTRHAAVAARLGAEGRADRMGLLFPGRGHAHRARPAHHPCRARAADRTYLMPLRDLADPEYLPALDTAYAIQRPALGLGAIDPAPRILPLRLAARTILFPAVRRGSGASAPLFRLRNAPLRSVHPPAT
jgi:hypothetical protein